jgi:hypothetical protein
LEVEFWVLSKPRRTQKLSRPSFKPHPTWSRQPPPTARPIPFAHIQLVDRGLLHQSRRTHAVAALEARLHAVERPNLLIAGLRNNPPCRASFALEGNLISRPRRERLMYCREPSFSGSTPNWSWSAVVCLAGKLNMKRAFAAVHERGRDRFGAPMPGSIMHQRPSFPQGSLPLTPTPVWARHGVSP